MRIRPLVVSLLLSAALASTARAEGFFQVRGFLPAPSVLSAFTVDAAYNTTFGDRSLDFKLSGVSLDRQSASVTYVAGRFFALAQLDRSATLLNEQGVLLGVVQGTFDGALQSLGLTVTNASGRGSGYAYATTSADVNATGRFSDTVTWTLSTGASLTDASGTNTTDLRARGEVKAQLTPDVQLGGGVGVSRTNTTGAATYEHARTFAFVNAGVNLTDQEKLGASGQLDVNGSYSLSASLDSGRFDPWTLSAQGGLTDDGATYALSATRTPDPLGVRLSFGGSSGAGASQNIDVEGQYQQGNFGAQFGGGVQLGAGGVTGTRLGAGVNASGGDLSAQVRANVSFGTATTGSLNGRVTFDLDPVRLDVGAGLTLGTTGLSGEVDAQVLYKLSDTIDFSASARYRPGTASPVQGGAGLRFRF